MKKAVFFGLGAVGATMATCLQELFEKRFPGELSFTFIVRNKQKAIDQLFRSKRLLAVSEFIEISDFNTLESEISRLRIVLGEVSLCVNAATPDFNDVIQKVAVALGANYCDMASDIYKEETLNNLNFLQQSHNNAFKDKNIFGLINAGISPGITNFLIGEKLSILKESNDYSNIKEINLFLLENIESEQIVFSWSPQVALDELENDPKFFDNDQLVTIKPFTDSKLYEFPHFPGVVRQYPIYQEELLSLKQSFPEISNIRVYTGGNEVELVKNLYQLNLLSDEKLPEIAGSTSISEMVKKVLPAMKSPEFIEKYLRDKVIRDAQFSAMAEIIVEAKSHGDKSTLLSEIVGLSYHRYHDLLDTEYSGATYISYPTGVGAAILLFYSYMKWLESPELINGILKGENIPSLVGESAVGNIKRELSSYDIDLVSHTHTVHDH